MNQLYKRITTTALIVAMVVPAIAGATTSPTNVADMLAQLKATQTQITALETQQKTTLQTLLRTLKEGISGDDVTMLQELLASDPSIYPEGKITGFYGKLTAQAVKRFQKKHGFEQVGYVGPQTLKKLNELMKENLLEIRDVEMGHASTTPMDLQKATMEMLLHTLKEGVRGDDVTILQALLASDPSIYPEGKITGFYGKLTAQAVKRFQKKHGFEQVGHVGPQTLKKLNELMKENPLEIRDVEMDLKKVEGKKEHDDDNKKKTERVVCHKVPLGHLVAPGWLKKHDNEQPTVPDCQTLPSGIKKKLEGGTTTPDTIAPIISAVVAGSVTTNSALVTWTTNEVATSQVYVGTMNPASVGSSTLVQVAGLTLAHSVALTGLTNGATYYMMVVSTDASGNTTTSGQVSFTTTVTPDTTAPVISAVTTSLVATTTATVSWTTNESATGHVYFGTVNPVVIASSTAVAANTAAASQSVLLSGLTASTTYFYVVDAKDASNNVSTSAQQSFTTTI